MVIVNDIKTIIEELNKIIVRNVNTIMLQTYWSKGRRIIEEEQKGNEKAEYDSVLFKELSKEITKKYGKFFSKSNLFSMRRFYLEFQK